MFSDPRFTEAAKRLLVNGGKATFNVSYSFDYVREQGIYQTTREGTVNVRVFAGPFHLDISETIDGFIFQMLEEKGSR